MASPGKVRNRFFRNKDLLVPLGITGCSGRHEPRFAALEEMRTEDGSRLVSQSETGGSAVISARPMSRKERKLYAKYVRARKLRTILRSDWKAVKLASRKPNPESGTKKFPTSVALDPVSSRPQERGPRRGVPYQNFDEDVHRGWVATLKKTGS